MCTGGDWTILTYFRFRAQHRMWNANNQKLVESDENESKENFHSSPEDVKNFKLNTLNAKWLYLTIFTNWRYVLSAVFFLICNTLANFYSLVAVIFVRCFFKRFIFGSLEDLAISESYFLWTSFSFKHVYSLRHILFY